MAHTRQYAGRHVSFDAFGFFVDPTEWDPAVATAIAQERGIDRLTDSHWQVIHFAREYTRMHGQQPCTRRIADRVGCTPRDLDALFPAGHRRTLALIAGIPRQRPCLW